MNRHYVLNFTMTLLLHAILFCVPFVRASLPGLNDTCIHTLDASESPSCNTRTLWSILLSCGSTLFACTWTAIHPNITGIDDGVIAITFRRLYLMVIALIAPEIMTAWAGWQFLRARQAAKDFDDAFGAQHAQSHGDRQAISQSKLAVKLIGDIPNSSRSSSAGWTMTHGYFALMGGFMLYVDGRAGSVDMPVITEAEIKDRSKGDGLSKCVAVLQLVWFVIQLIARYAQKLPVTLLEIDTLAIAALTCIAYGLWWKKPKDIGRPYIVHWNLEAAAPPPRDSLLYNEPLSQWFKKLRNPPPSSLLETQVSCISVIGIPFLVKMLPSHCRWYGKIFLALNTILVFIAFFGLCTYDDELTITTSWRIRYSSLDQVYSTKYGNLPQSSRIAVKIRSMSTTRPNSNLVVGRCYAYIPREQCSMN
ncbi:hypothetical protein EDB19DRAFT_2026903 [Suillus lakei]|nr:hypothetical protein EDB19DRAFT_2026903 [Suillus lakei]